MNGVPASGLDLRLEGKVAVVVGTGPAIGRSCVTGLARAGGAGGLFRPRPRCGQGLGRCRPGRGQPA